MSLDQDIRRLAAVALFAGMGRDALRLMAFAAERVDVKAGETIFQAADPTDGGMVVLSGSVELIRPAESPEPFRTLGAGALLGEHALLAAGLRTVTARARDNVSLLKISRALFKRVLEEHPENAIAIRRRWAAQLSARLEKR